MIHAFRDFLFANAVIGGLLTSVLCATLGVFVVLRRLEPLGLALPQAGAAGIALAIWIVGHSHDGGATGHGAPFAGALAGTFAALWLLAATRRSPVPTSSRVAAIFAISSALTILFVSWNPAGDFEVTSLLRGELLAIDDTDLVILAACGAVTACVFAWYRREILLSSVDPEFLRTLGRNPARYDAILYVLLGVAISLGVMLAGPLVVFGFLVLPGIAALRLAGSIAGAFAVACAVASAASLGGFALAWRADLPAGPVEVALAATPWLIAGGFSVARRLARSLT